MARIPLDPPRSPVLKLGEWYSRRKFGDVADPARAMAHQPQVLRSIMRLEMRVQRWKTLPPGLETLATMAAAAAIGCEWCLDFGYWVGMDAGVDPAKVHDVARWRESAVFDDLERAVFAYAEAMSTTPVGVTDEHVARLREHLDDAQLVELTMLVAIENERARFNSALGLASQGFAERCELKPSLP